jgi:long-chain acyl-CoA synthetase
LPTKNKMNLDKFQNLIELYLNQEKKQKPKSNFLEWLNPKNKVKFTWEETTSSIYKIANTIKENIKDGDRCLIVSENRPEWLISDIAIMLANGVTVPAYTTYTEKDYKYLIEDCEPSIIIVSNNIMHNKLKKIIDENIFIKKIITFDEIKNVNYKNKYINFNSIVQKKLEKSDKIKNLSLKRNSPACIIYTSGTGGNPKGVILSHGGILNNLEGACEILKPLNDKKPIFLTWLPLSHSYEHTVQFVQIAVGAKVFYAEKIEKLLENMVVAQPTIMTAVPRFYQNLYNKINANMKKAKGIKAKLIKLTIVLGKKNLLKNKMSFLEIFLN